MEILIFKLGKQYKTNLHNKENNTEQDHALQIRDINLQVMIVFL